MMKLPASDIKKIAVFRALQLGDLLCSIPAIRALRNAYPEAHIVLIGLPWSKVLIPRFPKYFDEFIHFPGYPGLPEQTFEAREFLSFLSVMQEENFDLVLQMQGNGNIVNPMVELFGGAQTAGFFINKIYYPQNGLFVQYPEHIHEVERHLKLMAHLGLETMGSYLEFPLLPADYAEVNALALNLLPGNYVCVHPGSRGAWRQWPPAHFAMLADHCASQYLQVVLTGTNDEMDIVNEVAGLMKHEPVIVAGKTSLGAVGVLIKNARLLISNCTGVSHISAATQTPGVIISMDGEPERWGPMNHALHRTIDWTVNNNLDEVLEVLKDLLVSNRDADEIGNKIPGVIDAR